VLMRFGGGGGEAEAWRFEPDPAGPWRARFRAESAPERQPLKQELLARIDAVLPRMWLIASSTSGLLASRMSENCAHPGEW